MEAPDTPPFPSRVGRYRVLGPLGVGGMASVYLAASEGAAGFTREVALKVLHPHLLGDAHLVQQFLTEARVAAKIRHPNVVPVTDVVQDRSWAYLVMEFVEGASLAELRRAARAEGGLPQRIWARWLADALAGLHAAHELKDEHGHELGVIHRDFSPQNILIGRDGSARLSDFGVVKLSSGDQHTQSGVVKGKVNYMSPEQVRGEPLDRRCDVWAAGVLAWELVTGRRLRHHKDDVQILLEIVSGDPVRASTLSADVNPELDDLIAWALRTDLAERCPSATVLRSQLLQTLGSSGVADSGECADWIERHAGELLDERRHKIRAARALRDQLDSLFDTPSSVEGTTPLHSEPPPRLAPSTAPPSVAPEPEPSLMRSTVAPQSRRLTVTRWLLIAGASIAAAAAAASMLSKEEEPSVEALPATAQPSTVPSSQPPQAAPKLVLEANQPIVALAIDGRDVRIGAAKTRIEIELPVFARGRSELKLDARSASGQTASRLWSGEGPLHFEFSAAKRSRAGKPRAPAPAAKPSAKTPLAKNPYPK